MITVDVEKRQGIFKVAAAFQAPAKGVTAIFGPSGAGKTSIIDMVGGLLCPDRGHIQVNGRCLFDSRNKFNLPPDRRRIGYVFQDGRLFPHMSVRTNLTYGLRRTRPEHRYGLQEVVTLLGIGHLLDRRPAKLSGGEKQRVAIGRALLTSPALLLMDEPLASLDKSRKTEILPFIARLSNEFDIPILYVSHAWDEIEAIAETLIVVNAGRICATGPLSDIASNKASIKN